MQVLADADGAAIGKIAGLRKLVSIDMHADTLSRMSAIAVNERRTKMGKGNKF
jgi:hypothetical protein